MNDKDLETLFETGSLTEEQLYLDLHKRLDQLGGKLNRFTQSVETSHRSVKEDSETYEADA